MELKFDLDLSHYPIDPAQPIGNCQPCQGTGRVAIIVQYTIGEIYNRVYQPSAKCPACQGTGTQLLRNTP